MNLATALARAGMVTIVAACSVACGGDDSALGGCTVSCGRVGINLDETFIRGITEEDCAARAEPSNCTASFCPPGAADSRDCYEVPRED